jgi:excisionase family DNA binding protein
MVRRDGRRGQMSSKIEENRGDLSEKRRGLSVQQASDRGGWSRATTYRLINSGKLKSVKVLGRRIITSEAVDAVLDGGEQ